MTNKYEKCNSPETAMKVLKVIGMVLLGIAAGFAIGFVIMLLWNWLMPLIFGLTEITYWQSIGILILTSILFGRLGGSSGESKKEKSGKSPIKDAIKDEIKKEFEKEATRKANTDYEGMYEKWWESEGEKCFEKYMSSSKEDVPSN